VFCSETSKLRVEQLLGRVNGFLRDPRGPPPRLKSTQEKEASAVILISWPPGALHSLTVELANAISEGEEHQDYRKWFE
jgi:hypothetical protein